MPDIYLWEGEATPSDVKLHTGRQEVYGTAASAQAAQISLGAGTVTAAVVPAPVVTVGHGPGSRGHRHYFVVRPIIWPVKPVVISGVGESRQAAQTSRALGGVRQRIKGVAVSVQSAQVSMARGKHSTARRDERDLIEILMLLDAA